MSTELRIHPTSCIHDALRLLIDELERFAEAPWYLDFVIAQWGAPAVLLQAQNEELGPLSVEPQRLQALLQTSGFDTLLISSSAIHFGVFDSSFLFVDAEEGILDDLQLAVHGNYIRESPQTLGALRRRFSSRQ